MGSLQLLTVWKRVQVLGEDKLGRRSEASNAETQKNPSASCGKSRGIGGELLAKLAVDFVSAKQYSFYK